MRILKFIGSIFTAWWRVERARLKKMLARDHYDRDDDGS